MAELAEEATESYRGEVTAVGNSIIVTTSVTDLFMNLKSPKFMSFIILIDSLFCTSSKRHGCAYH